MAILALTSGATPPGSLDASIQNFRSQKGQVMVCLTTQARNFPNCQDDPHARRMTVPTHLAANITFSDLPTGEYALALIHDENGNGKLDTTFGIPREGFGFTKNPAIRFGPPSFKSATVTITSGQVDETVRVKYLF